MKSLKGISYHLACQKAYKGQMNCPYVVFKKSSGMWGASPHKTWSLMKPGTPYLYVSHVAMGMCVAGWEYRDGTENHE